MAASETLRKCRDAILNNKVVTCLSVALFAFVIATIALATSNQSKKNAIQVCQAVLSHATPLCSVSISNDLPDYAPVYLRSDGNSYKLWAPSGSLLKWNTTQEKTALLCSGDNNVLERTNIQFNENTCSSGQEFLLVGATSSIATKDLKCKSSVDGECDATTESCANGRGVLNKLGFNSGQSSGFITYIEACFDKDRSSVLYTRHILPGGAIANAVSADAYQTWRTTGIDEKVTIETSYTQASQIDRLTTLLGSKEQAAKYVQEGVNYLTRGHLTPRGDGIFQSWKHATFFYTNAVPQWNVINEGNWNNIELRVRMIASVLQEDLLVVQGTFGVLSLLDANSISQPISLSTAGIDVPLWVWKIIKSPSRNAGIAFVTLNNPYETSSIIELLCTDVCEKYGWAEVQYSKFSAGFTYCCDPNDLIRMVPHAPYEALVKDVLTQSMLTSNGVSLSSWLCLVVAAGLLQLLRVV